MSRQLFVRTLSRRSTTGFVAVGRLWVPCALGRGGQRILKREGDGATPVGRFRLLDVFYRADKVARPRTRLRIRRTRPNDGWCDDPEDRNYNQHVSLPYRGRSERLWRDDALYDLVVVVDYNVRPRRRQRGSAIFIHIARRDYLPTQGCIALKRSDLRRLLRFLARDTRITVGQ